MHICYVLLSPTFGMHQYTADLANGAVQIEVGDGKNQVHVVTVRDTPIDRFAPQVDVQPIVNLRGTGLAPGNFNPGAFLQVYRAIVGTRPDVVHFTGPHIWNPPLLWLLHRAGYPTIHTIHDLDPHSGSGYGRLLYVWNNTIKRWADHILVHGETYRTRLIAQGIAAHRVTYAPLLHLFLNYESEKSLGERYTAEQLPPASADAFALFFARLEAYKGIHVLIEAMRELKETPGAAHVRIVIAGNGDIGKLVTGPLPDNVEVRNRLIADPEAIDLFSHCSVVVLPYIDATQSALIAAAYYFGKPVMVTRVGALPEYVIEGETGRIIEPHDSKALADCLRTAFSSQTHLAHMGQAGRHWYESQRKMERRTLSLMYERVYIEGHASHVRLEQAPGGNYVDR